MLGSVLIILFSAALLIYWFRYTCILLVRDYASQPELARAVAHSSFSFADVRERLQSSADLDPLHAALARDYQVLTYLVRHASGLAIESFEERMLIWDYRMMQLWYSVTKTAAPEQAREALSEMASVLGILAGRIGQRAGVQGEA
jgi:hypothetical protein